MELDWKKGIWQSKIKQKKITNKYEKGSGKWPQGLAVS
jgi:hypothetical protein